MEVTQEELKQAKKEVSKLTVLLNKTLKWFPKIKGMLNLESFCFTVDFNQE